MKFSKSITTAFGAASLLGATLLPVSVFAGEQVQPVEAEIQPTTQELRAELMNVGRKLHTTEHASVSNPTADRDYVAAWRDYHEGYYGNALDQARAADDAIASEPNWIDDTVAK